MAHAGDVGGGRRLVTKPYFDELHADLANGGDGHLCKIISRAKDDFVTRVTINNNRQNPVEPWNLRANDTIQLELQDKFADELKLYYERQENAFDQLSVDDLRY
jgi:hypothetical protein